MRTSTLFAGLIFTILLLLFTSEVKATHVMGASITYECDSTCKYRFYQSIIYDCPIYLPQTRNPSFMWVRTAGAANCTTSTLVDSSWVYISTTEVTPICPSIGTTCSNSMNPIRGATEASFIFDTTFCNSSCPILSIEFGVGGRNYASAFPVNEGLYLETKIDLSTSPCNSSPQFQGLDAPYICAGAPAYIDQHAFDPDGDSLVYALVPCYRGRLWPSGLDTIRYNPGFSFANPLGSSWLVDIDPKTGVVSVLPNSGNVVVGNICVQVKEYRNGLLIGEILKDIQINVLSCSVSNQNPQLDSLNIIQGGRELLPRQFLMCLDDTFKAELFISDPDTAQKLIFSIPNLLPGIAIDTTQISTGVVSFSFTPGKPGTYIIPFFLWDNVCPISGSFSQSFSIRVEGICVTTNITSSPCGQAAGTIDLTVTSGLAPFQFLWSNGATTEDIGNLVPGVYSVQITDANGYRFVDGFLVNASSISMNLSIFHPTCNQSGSILVSNIQGGIPPYSFAWNTGDTTQNLLYQTPGNYSIMVTDSTGCSHQQIRTLFQPDSCYNTIEGILFDDINQNCIQDAGEIPLPNIIVDLTPGGAVMTNSQGEYFFKVDTGNYEISVIAPPNKFFTCPTNGKQTYRLDSLKNFLNSENVGLYTDSVQDLRIVYSQNQARPGFMVNHYLNVYNDGQNTVNALVQWTHDSIFEYISATPMPGSYDSTTRRATWAFFQFPPNQNRQITISTRVKTTVSSGVAYTNTGVAEPINSDFFPSNNTVNFNGTTTNSYDPNDKNVQPPGMGNLGLIEADQRALTYTVRFQNTGTDTAFTVVIRDTIDDQRLDALSFQKQVESHPYSLTIERDKVLVFEFKDILLPDSSTNLSGSQGFVTFSIMLKDSLPIGTAIKNSAAIFFDFNPPIITNTTLNTVFAYPQLELGGDTTICEGEPVIALVTSPGLPPYTFDWSDGTTDPGNTSGLSQTLVNGSGNYQVTITDALGIQANDSVLITAAPLADAGFSISPVGLTVAFNNTANVNTSWDWDFGDGQRATGAGVQVHRYAQNGLYTVTLITTNDCGSDTLRQDVDLRNVSIDDALFAQSVQLVPHPVQDVSYLRFANANGETFSLRILDLQGRVVKKYGETRNNEFMISRGELATGIYMYELIGSHSYFGKMVVK